MSLSKLDSNPQISDQVFEAIHSAIMSGAFPSGARLQIRDLAAELGTSEMPVREAIKRLEALELVDRVPYRGAVVKALSVEELDRTYAVRRLLEVEATRLAAARGATVNAEQLEAGYESMLAALDQGDVAAYLDRDEDILELIYAAADNDVLIDTIRTFWHRCRPVKIVGARHELDRDETEPLRVYQRRLIDAVVAGDVEAACETTAESITAAAARIDAMLRNS